MRGTKKARTNKKQHFCPIADKIEYKHIYLKKVIYGTLLPCPNSPRRYDKKGKTRIRNGNKIFVCVCTIACHRTEEMMAVPHNTSFLHTHTHLDRDRDRTRSVQRTVHINK
eukprot:GEMP01104714.1.p1 GENE.GEMP01104714.1~~GEMP01104714.1.p1  ORF type:complete len:111 (-),score=0.83 GEMP01104714.1:322-654(-)